MALALEDVYRQITNADDQVSYYVPSVWVQKTGSQLVKTTIRQFFSRHIQNILKHPKLCIFGN